MVKGLGFVGPKCQLSIFGRGGVPLSIKQRERKSEFPSRTRNLQNPFFVSLKNAIFFFWGLSFLFWVILEIHVSDDKKLDRVNYECVLVLWICKVLIFVVLIFFLSLHIMMCNFDQDSIPWSFFWFVLDLADEEATQMLVTLIIWFSSICNLEFLASNYMLLGVFQLVFVGVSFLFFNSLFSSSSFFFFWCLLKHRSCMWFFSLIFLIIQAHGAAGFRPIFSE